MHSRAWAENRFVSHMRESFGYLAASEVRPYEIYFDGSKLGLYTYTEGGISYVCSGMSFSLSDLRNVGVTLIPVVDNNLDFSHPRTVRMPLSEVPLSLEGGVADLVHGCIPYFEHASDLLEDSPFVRAVRRVIKGKV